MEWTWLITIAAITGTVANIYKRRWCFCVWTITNCIWCFIDFAAGLYAQAFLFAIYAVLAIWGLVQWRKEKN
ncbi:MAG: Nicotinamide mononucleotide transporter [Pelotomaculum sp. PtaB.Bin104]|nr:MAG: Nicotinamide mononucleotide transporter [Pelotomaculum sp. PtaB.Bin104]